MKVFCRKDESLTEVSPNEDAQTLTVTFRNLLHLQPILRELLKTPGAAPHILALYMGPPGSGRSVLCKQYAYEFLKEGRKVIYMSTERSSADIVERMLGHGWDVRPYLRSSLRLVDMYSWLEDGNQNYVETPSGSRLCPINTTDMQLSMTKFYEELGAGWNVVIFDSLSTLIGMIGEERALRLIPSVAAKIRQHGSAVVSMTSGIHSESTLAQLHSLFDLVVEMRIEAGEHLNRELRIAKYTLGSHPDGWISFHMLDQGISLDV
jgi:KaiC/GvpD/RAD55 family RecA-like ATPase